MDSLPNLDDLSPDYVDYNQGPVAGRVGAAMIGVSVALVILRLAARLVRTTRLGLDDWILVGGLVGARPSIRPRSTDGAANTCPYQIPAVAYMTTTIVCE